MLYWYLIEERNTALAQSHWPFFDKHKLHDDVQNCLLKTLNYVSNSKKSNKNLENKLFQATEKQTASTNQMYFPVHFQLLHKFSKSQLGEHEFYWFRASSLSVIPSFASLVAAKAVRLLFWKDLLAFNTKVISIIKYSTNYYKHNASHLTERKLLGIPYWCSERCHLHCFVSLVFYQSKVCQIFSSLHVSSNSI